LYEYPMECAEAAFWFSGAVTMTTLVVSMLHCG